MSSDTPPLCRAPRTDAVAPQFEMPANACDCHFHVFDDPSPQVLPRTYTAPRASAEALTQLHRTLGITRGVVVQPSIYGTDNRTTLSAITNTDTMKAIAVVGGAVTPAQLRDLRDAGVVGCRVNQLFASNAATGELQALARKIRDVNWHLQMLTDVSAFADLASTVRALDVPVVFDHMGHMPAGKGVDHPGFQQLLRLLGEGRVWVKLSGAYRLSVDGDSDFADVAPLAEVLVRTNPERLVWGSDWPHPHVEAMPNDTHLLNLLATWVPDAETRHRILVQNPESLYGF